MRRSASAGGEDTAYVEALRCLARRDRSEAEVRRILVRRGHDTAHIEAALGRLRAGHLLDDARFAERFARSRLVHHGLGRGRIRQALRQKGVGRAEVDAGIAAALREVGEAEVLDGLARRYWRLHARLAPRRRLPHLWAFLLRRGFGPDLVRERLAALWPRWTDALDGLEPLEPDRQEPDGSGIHEASEPPPRA